MPPLKCKVCNIALQSNKVMQDHLNGKRHQKNAAQYGKISGLFITGFHDAASKEDILHYFSQFGSIQWTRVGPTLNYMIIRYENRNEAENVMNRNHTIHGKQLIVRWENNYSEPAKDQPDELPMLQRIVNIPMLDMQINKFIEFLTPNLDQMELLYKIVTKDLGNAMEIMFHSPIVYPFGSATTTLQFKSSDLDIFIKIESDETYLTKARKALYRSNKFDNVLVVSSAKIPIVKCIHNGTKLKCDINFKSMLGVKNSELIRYYISLDSKIRPFLLVLKYWGKVHEITGRNHLFTNYSLVLMAIFYLQLQHSFPSVHVLQYETVPTDSKVIWNMNLSDVQKQENQCWIYASLKSLLQGFFSFYAKFDYKSYIICPYLGTPIDRNLFSDESTIPNEFHIYKENLKDLQPLKIDSSICVQDPFEHNFNTCRIIFQNILEKYVSLCGVAQSILSMEQEDKMLYALFSNDTKSIKELTVPPQYLICMKMHDASAISNFIPCPGTCQLWVEKVLNYLENLFENVLKLDINKIENSKTSKVDNQKDVYDQDLIRYKAFSSVDVWTTRQNVANSIEDQLEKCETDWKKELLISSHIWNSSNGPKSELFQCQIDVSVHKNPIRININFYIFKKSGNSLKDFDSFFKVVNSNVKKWYEFYEKDSEIVN